MAIDDSVLPQSTAAAPRASARRILILGGTGDAFELAARLAGCEGLTVISSLAGRVAQPRLPVGIVRVGGFGGVDGLIQYVAAEEIDAVIDATHPFACQISRNAELACAAASVPLIAFERPQWNPERGDCWTRVPDAAAAAAHADQHGNRVLLSIGRQELAAFSSCSRAWFLVRAIDVPGASLPRNSELLLQRGPFDLAAEVQMLRAHSINLIVSKNSGGAATYSKIEAARDLGIRILMIERPRKHSIQTVLHQDEVLQQLEQLCAGLSLQNPPTSEMLLL